jgi:hypothetical protein
MIETSRRGLILGAGALGIGSLLAAIPLLRFGKPIPARDAITLPTAMEDGHVIEICNYKPWLLDVFLPSQKLPVATLRQGDSLVSYGGFGGSYIVTSSSWCGKDMGWVMDKLLAVGP